MKLIDITVPVEAAVPVYPGNTPFTLEAIKRVARGDSSTIHMSAHSGTHIDAPRHFFDDGAGVEGLPLEMLMGRARVIELTTRKGIVPEDFAGLDLSELSERDTVRLLELLENPPKPPPALMAAARRRATRPRRTQGK